MRKCYFYSCDKPQADAPEYLLLMRHVLLLLMKVLLSGCFIFPVWALHSASQILPEIISDASHFLGQCLTLHLRWDQLLNLPWFWTIEPCQHAASQNPFLLYSFRWQCTSGSPQKLLSLTCMMQSRVVREIESDTGLTASCLWTLQILQRIWRWAEWFWLYGDSVFFFFWSFDIPAFEVDLLISVLQMLPAFQWRWPKDLF